MDLPKFFKLFEAVDNIMEERDLLDKVQKYRLAPAIDLIDTRIRRDEITFRKTLLQMKPVYEIAISVKTEEEFQEERLQDHLQAKKKSQEDFAKYVEDLKDKLNKRIITPKEYREKIMNFKK
jgi:antirestriction protein